MQSPYCFIVKPFQGGRYSNTQVIGGIEFIVSASQEDHKYSNRLAEVISVPLNYKGEIVKGDILVVHHNIFKYYYDMKGRTKSGRAYFQDDLFFVEPDMYFLYFHNGEWKTHDKYCFVKPIKPIQGAIEKNIEEEPLMGIMKYSNEELKELGVNTGDLVSFTPDSEYEFIIGEEKLYRMFTENITAICS